LVLVIKIAVDFHSFVTFNQMISINDNDTHMSVTNTVNI